MTASTVAFMGGYGYGYHGFYFDWTYLLVILAVILSGAASMKMKSAFSRYSRVPSRSGLSGAEAAQSLLHAAGIYDVRITHIRGNLTDHYNPKDKTLALSDTVYGSRSLAAVCVAAHECGHAVQHNRGYAPLAWRSAIVPVANIGSSLAIPIFIMGLIFSIPALMKAGIVFFLFAVIFQLVTLPVEVNASSRALRMLQGCGIMGDNELRDGRKVLSAAAMTYVAALAGSLLQLLRLVILAGGRDRD